MVVSSRSFVDKVPTSHGATYGHKLDAHAAIWGHAWMHGDVPLCMAACARLCADMVRSAACSSSQKEERKEHIGGVIFRRSPAGRLVLGLNDARDQCGSNGTTPELR